MLESTTPTTLAPVKSKWASKTNITAALLAVFGLLAAFGLLPADLATPQSVGAIVTAGAALVAFFRTTATHILQ